jgi:hypothetical protein
MNHGLSFPNRHSTALQTYEIVPSETPKGINKKYIASMAKLGAETGKTLEKSGTILKTKLPPQK